MLQPKGSRLGAFDFKTRRLEESEKKFYGIFLSHAAADTERYLYPLRDAMVQMGMHPLCDRDFLAGGDDFQSKIEGNLDCYAAVVIVTAAALRSDWVNYESGILAGRGIPIFLYDPEQVLSRAPREGEEDLRLFADSHYNAFLPAHPDLASILSALSTLTPYAEMFTEETAFLDCATFRARMKDRVETVIATLESDIFDEHYEDFAACRIGTLVPNFGMFYPDHGDGEHCYAGGRCRPLTDRRCPRNGLECALSLPRQLGEENKECVLLNHVLPNGRVFRRGDTDRRGERIERGCVMFHLPVHRLYGTEFKFILDVQDNAAYTRLMSILDQAGMNPSASQSAMGGRIYLSLPERRAQGLFRLDHQFENNFLCPHAARSGGEG